MLFTDALGWDALGARIGVAVLAGLVIGWDRQRTGKPAGMRTHMLVSLGSCLLVLVPLSMGAGAEAVTRVIQGVAAGVGFLGGGEIIHLRRDDQHEKIKGLTSAAAMWLTASLGIIAACGLWRTTLLALAAALTILILVKPLEMVLFPRRPPGAGAGTPDQSRR